MSRTGQHPRVLQLSLGLERADLTLRGTLGVEAQAPAATEDAVVELDQRAVGRPRALIQCRHPKRTGHHPTLDDQALPVDTTRRAPGHGDAGDLGQRASTGRGTSPDSIPDRLVPHTGGDGNLARGTASASSTSSHVKPDPEPIIRELRGRRPCFHDSDGAGSRERGRCGRGDRSTSVRTRVRIASPFMKMDKLVGENVSPHVRRWYADPGRSAGARARNYGIVGTAVVWPQRSRHVGDGPRTSTSLAPTRPSCGVARPGSSRAAGWSASSSSRLFTRSANAATGCVTPVPGGSRTWLLVGQSKHRRSDRPSFWQFVPDLRG